MTEVTPGVTPKAETAGDPVKTVGDAAKAVGDSADAAQKVKNLLGL